MIAEALTFHGRATAGRSRPLRCDARLPNGETAEVFVKAVGLEPHLTPSKLTTEWIATRMALRFGLHAARPLLVRMSPEFIETIEDDSLRITLTEAPPLAYGSRSLGDGWRPFNVRSRISPDLVPAALDIYMFDTLLGNWDREEINPNLLVRGDRIGLIDHEEALFADDGFAECPAVPWRPGQILNTSRGDKRHALVAQFERRSELPWQAAFAKWECLPRTAARPYVAEVPDAWDRDAADGANSFVEKLFDRLDDAKREVGRALAWLG